MHHIHKSEQITQFLDVMEVLPISCRYRYLVTHKTIKGKLKRGFSLLTVAVMLNHVNLLFYFLSVFACMLVCGWLFWRSCYASALCTNTGIRATFFFFRHLVSELRVNMLEDHREEHDVVGAAIDDFGSLVKRLDEKGFSCWITTLRKAVWFSWLASQE